jgi:hypothetical protein
MWLQVYLLIVATFAALFHMNIGEPRILNDSRYYMTVAENLATNACYASSNPAAAECKPTWGNQPPGYPVFITMLRLVGHGRPHEIVAAQTIIFITATVAYLFAAYLLWPVRPLIILLPSVVCLASPLTAAWSAFILTDTLAASSTLFLFAALMRSIKSKSLSVYTVAPALLCATVVRWDQVCLIFSVLVLAFYLDGIRRAIPRMFAVLTPTAMVFTLLIARAALIGLPPLPSIVSDQALPPGIIYFWRVSTLSPSNTTAFLWPIWNRTFERIPIDFDYNAIPIALKTDRLHDLIGRLGTLSDGDLVPPDLDQEFGSLAAEFQSAHPLSAFLEVPLVRAWKLWVAEDLVFHSGWEDTYFEPLRRLYRVFLLLSSPLIFLLSGKDNSARMLALAVLVYVISRTLFLVEYTALETRYLVPMLPLLELQFFFLAALFVDRWLRRGSETDRARAS